MDINIALTRAGIFAIVYTLVLGIPFWIGYFTKAWFPSTAMAIALASLGPFIYSTLRRRAESVLRKEQLVYQEKLRTISSTMMLNKDLDRLLRTIVLSVVDTVKVKWAVIYLKDEKTPGYILKYSKARHDQVELPAVIPPDTELLSRLSKARLPLIGEEIETLELKIGLAVPCFIEEKLLGFLFLGEKPQAQVYDASDVNVFALLSNQTALAIENCQFYALEKQQEHSRRILSLDNQISCMAHEIDNPIQALLSNIGSAIVNMEFMKEKKTLSENDFDILNAKLLRATFNAKRVSTMIESVREFSKPSTGELSVITLQNIMESFNAIAQPQFNHNGINYIQEIPEGMLWLRANKVEIEQVLINLATNSIQAINEVYATKTASPGAKKTIHFKAYCPSPILLKIECSDNGSGIKKPLLEDIFLDFVTTKASTIGTGLGLAIARKIINRHRGKIWAESEGENKGATFHIELPIAADITEEDKRRFQEDQDEHKKKYLI